MDLKNLATVRQSFANTVFTHKVQEVAVEYQEQKSFWIKIINIILVSLVLIFLFLQTQYPDNIIFSYIGVAITISEIIFLVIQLTFSFEQRAISHKNSALKFLGLRDSYRALITDIMNGNIAKKEIIYRRDLLQKEYQIICELAPQTSGNEYTEAQKRLNKKGAVQGEEFSWSDKEIDWFLPEELRLKK
jgi:hypothetical protein